MVKEQREGQREMCMTLPFQVSSHRQKGPVSQTPPGIPLPGNAAGFPSGKLSCMSWAPQLSGGAQRCRCVAALPCRVIKWPDRDPAAISSPRSPHATLSLCRSRFQPLPPPPSPAACSRLVSCCRTPPDRVGRPCWLSWHYFNLVFTC